MWYCFSFLFLFFILTKSLIWILIYFFFLIYEFDCLGLSWILLDPISLCYLQIRAWYSVSFEIFFFFLLFPVFPSWNWIIFEGGFLAVSESGGWSFRIVERGHTFLDCMALNFLDKGLWLRIRLGFILALFLVVVVALDLHVWVIAGGPLPLCGGSQKFSSFFFFLLSLAFCLDFCLRNVFVELLKRSVA